VYLTFFPIFSIRLYHKSSSSISSSNSRSMIIMSV